MESLIKLGNTFRWDWERCCFSFLSIHPDIFCLNKGKYLANHNLQDDRGVIIKLADKGSAVVVWNRSICLKKVARQLIESGTCKVLKLIKVSFRFG